MTGEFDLADLLLLAHWMDAEGGSLAEFIDVIERPDRWQAELNAARALAEMCLDFGGLE
jgi:hypothetical protein